MEGRDLCSGQTSSSSGLWGDGESVGRDRRACSGSAHRCRSAASRPHRGIPGRAESRATPEAGWPGASDSRSRRDRSGRATARHRHVPRHGRRFVRRAVVNGRWKARCMTSWSYNAFSRDRQQYTFCSFAIPAPCRTPIPSTVTATARKLRANRLSLTESCSYGPVPAAQTLREPNAVSLPVAIGAPREIVRSTSARICCYSATSRAASSRLDSSYGRFRPHAVSSQSR